MARNMDPINWEAAIVDMWNKLRCSRCRNIVRKGDIYCCIRNKHLLCQSCAPNGTTQCNFYQNGYSCQSELASQVYLEEILKSMPFPCPYREKGCTLILKCSEMDEHLLECSYTNFTCPIVPNCSPLTFSSFLNHIHKLHSNILTKKQIRGAMECSFIINPSSERYFCVWYIDVWGTFLYRREYDANHSTTFHVVQFAGNTEESSKFRFTASEEGDGRSSTFTGMVEPVAFSKEILLRRGNSMMVCGKSDSWNCKTTVTIHKSNGNRTSQIASDTLLTTPD